MKTPILWSVRPQKPMALLVFCAFAFLPAALHLACANFPVTRPLAALGPVIAGFWFAAGIREIRVSLAVLTTVTGALLWSVNWLMFAGGDCCSAPH